MTDYEKAEKQSWENYLASDLRKLTGKHEWLAHKTGFRDAYRYAKSQPVGNTDKSQLRATAAIAAMQGLLANGNIQHQNIVAKRAVACADALITELDKTKDNGN